MLFARQPIFNHNNKLYGYELLYREGENNTYDCLNGDVATSNVMAAGFLSMDVNEITGKKKAFINFTASMILHRVATLFPRDKIVVEILENVEPSEAIVSACKSLKADGYNLALDDFTYKKGYETLIEMADIIKVDFRLTKTESDRKHIVKQFRNGKKIFLAEKVEDFNDYQMAIKAGYTLFQGYYFAKPVLTSSKEVPAAKINHLNLIRVLESKEPKFDDITRIIEKDVAFSYEILRIVNTAYYYQTKRIVSVKEAAILMGLDELKKWAYITTLRKMGGDEQDFIVNTCALRAKTLEILCGKIGSPERRMEFFTLGILSMIDVLTGYSMKILLPELPISKEAKRLLIGDFDDNKMSACYRLVLAYEKGEWDRIYYYSKKYRINVNDVTQAYYEAIVWTNSYDLN